MTRILLLSGKGGVGKTTVAAATGLACAKLGYRTNIISLDVAHSLADSFDLDRGLFDQNKGRPATITANLDVQEIDVHEDIARHWTEVFRYFTELFVRTGLDDVISEEVAIFPGTEDLIAMMYINQYILNDRYDVIVLDAPPTGESIRFVSIFSTLQWYMRKRFTLDRGLARLAGPLVSRLADLPVPDEGYFSSLKQLFKQLEGVDALLRDPAVTSVRLVTAAEKMIVRETQRAYLYFNLSGMTTDLVVVNRLIPAGQSYFARWVEAQAGYVEEIREYFQPALVATIPFFPDEVLGIDRLTNVAYALYGAGDPTVVHVTAPPFHFKKRRGEYLLEVNVPFARPEDVDVSRVGDAIILRIGSFKRQVPLPRAVQSLTILAADLSNDKLVVRLGRAAGRRAAEDAVAGD